MLVVALLVVLIIIVIGGLALHLTGYVGAADNMEAMPAGAAIKAAAKKIKVVPGELAALNENAEYFSSIAGDSSGAVHGGENFGSAGVVYDDYLTAVGVDPQAVKNHGEFVKDRTAQNNQNILGRTYSPDSHDSYDPIPWVGLRRPQAAPFSNPTQVPDVDHDLYSNKPKFTWRSD